jgi:hypothetical protein
MRSLQELRSLVALARRFGQEPSAELLEQIDLLEKDEAQRLKREAEIRARVAEDLTELFNLKGKANELVQSQTEQTPDTTITIAESTEPATVTEPIPVAEPTIAEKVAKVITEQGVVSPDPILARPQKNLELEIKYLREWVGKIAALGPGSGEVNFRYLDDVDRSSIGEDKYLAYDATAKKFFFDDTRCSIEAFDRSTSIALLATPQLLKPSSFTNDKHITYNSSTGVFTFLRECELTLALTVNALASASGQRVYQYAERNTGSGWTVIANSGKSFQLTNGQHTQIVNAQTISRLEGEQIRYYIYASEENKVNLITETLPNVSGNTVYIPAIRIQYAGR